MLFKKIWPLWVISFGWVVGLLMTSGLWWAERYIQILLVAAVWGAEVISVYVRDEWVLLTHLLTRKCATHTCRLHRNRQVVCASTLHHIKFLRGLICRPDERDEKTLGGLGVLKLVNRSASSVSDAVGKKTGAIKSPYVSSVCVCVCVCVCVQCLYKCDRDRSGCCSH